MVEKKNRKSESEKSVKAPDSINLSDYFAEDLSKARISILSRAKQNGQLLDLADVEDLFCLDLSPIEKSLLLDICTAKNPLALEAFFILCALRESQNVAVSAIENWVSRTPRSLYFYWPIVAAQEHVSQRVKFRILEHVGAIGCSSVIKQAEKFAHIDDYSEAFHRILLTRAVQWNIDSATVRELAQTYLGLWLENPHVHTATVPSALSYLLRFDRENVKSFVSKLEPNSIVVEYLKSVVGSGETALLNSEQWVAVWDRYKLSEEHIAHLVQDTKRSFYEYTGVSSKNIYSAIGGGSGTSGLEFIKLFVKFEPLMEESEKIEGLRAIKSLMEKTENLPDFIRAIPFRTSFQLQGMGKQSKISSEMWETKNNFRKSPEIDSVELETQLRNLVRILVEVDPILTPRKVFFYSTNDSKNSEHSKDSSDPAGEYWRTLSEFRKRPDLEKLSDLSTLQRRVPAIWRQTFVACLCFCKGMDEAVLKTLDFCRTEEEGVLRTIFSALKGIGTSKASMELVNYVTRPNVSLPLKFEIAETLKEMDTSKIQREIRSAISDLRDPKPVHSEFHELRNFLQGLLEPETQATHSGPEQDMATLAAQASPAFLDSSLRTTFRFFDDFSSEVRRALRTAKFFDNQTRNGSADSGIDLSPVVDMQYKALEILFRELFEKECTRFIQEGAMQRKLDIIGYARPIETEMTRFENYLAALPIVSSIPFFSKFKLRKLLRAICQYRPGKRFTLDGLKAFGLFFLTFGRKDDQFGLANILALPFANDRELAMFCKQLHEFQDLRNRAAHEGFHPDASQNIDAIWSVTSAISEIAWELHSYMKDKKAFGSKTITYGK